MPSHRAVPHARHLHALLVAAVLLLHGAPAFAQGAGPAFRATRADLETRASALEALAAGRDSTEPVRARAGRDAARLRSRLRDGDFQVGDRIVLTVANDAALSDTFSVVASRMLPLRNFGTVSLSGVLRSELTDRVRAELAKYFRDPQVTATPLVRVGVLGAVARPGYYATGPDIVVTDVVMQAGGPTGDADLARSIVRRGERELFNRDDFRVAVRQGQTLDEMNLVAGDEIVVGTRKATNWSAIFQATTVLLAVVGLAASLASN
jgi:protein involved in polysaccharide export with SLBB domain